MKRLVVTTVVMALVLALPLMAGEGKKCTYSTQECLDYMASKMKDRGWVGIEYDAETMVVKNVIPDSPALAGHTERYSNREQRGCHQENREES